MLSNLTTLIDHNDILEVLPEPKLKKNKTNKILLIKIKEDNSTQINGSQPPKNK